MYREVRKCFSAHWQADVYKSPVSNVSPLTGTRGVTNGRFQMFVKASPQGGALIRNARLYMKQGQFYFITNEFYKIHDKEKKLMQNKETIDGISRDRPCFYAFPDRNNAAVLWCVPISSKIDKYKGIYNKKIENQRQRGVKNPKCNTICFGEVMGRERAFLIQNMFPITKTYIAGVYINKATHSVVRISELTEKEIIENALQILKLVFHGNTRLVFSDIITTYKTLNAELGAEQSKQNMPKNK